MSTSALHLHLFAALNVASALIPVLLLILSVESCKIILIILFILFVIMLMSQHVQTLHLEKLGCLFILVDIAYLNTTRDDIHSFQIFGRVIRLSLACRHEVMFLMSRNFTNYSGPKLTVAYRTFDKTMTPSAICLALALSITSGTEANMAHPIPTVIVLGLIFCAMVYSMRCLDRELIYPVEHMLTILAESSNDALDEINKLGEKSISAKSPFSFHGDVVQYAVSGLSHVLVRTLCNDADENGVVLSHQGGGQATSKIPQSGVPDQEHNNQRRPRNSRAFTVARSASQDSIPREESYDDTVDPLFWTPVSTLGNPFLDLYESGRIREEEERLIAQTMTAASMKGNWDWDVLRLMRRHDCLDLVYRILEVDGLISHFKIAKDRMLNLLQKLGERYLSNYFHNVWHGTDVCFMTWRIIHETECENWFTKVETLATYVAAFGHDVGHPGLTNPFLVKTGSDIALLHNDISPLENMHAAILSALIRDTGVFETLSSEDKQIARATLISTILGTDTVHHMSQISDLRIFYETNGCLSPRHGGIDPLTLNDGNFHSQQRKFLLEVIVHVADINNPAKDWEGCRAWGYLLMDEFFSQGEKEHELGFNVLPTFDKKVASVPNIEMNFGEFFYFPLLLMMIQVFPSLEPMGRNLTNNISNWAQLRITELLNDHSKEMKKLGLTEDTPLSKNLQKEIDMLQSRGSIANDILTTEMNSLISYAKRE